MKTRITPMSRFLASLALLLTPLGCDGERGARDTNAPADVDADPADVTSDVSTDVPPDTAMPGDTTPGGPLPGCAEATLDGCEYPSLGVEFDERTGISTTEPVSGRSLPLLARVPRLPGPLPIVVWSHGGGFTNGGQNESDVWGETFARHGYVSLHVGHAPADADDIVAWCTAASVPPADCVPSGDPDEDSNGLLAIGRSYDVKAVLDDLARLSQISVNNGGPAIDLTRVVVAGWSGGSRGPMMVMGARNKPSPNTPVFTNAHARPIAAIFMSPAGPTFGGWFDDGNATSWSDMRGPTFTATGSNDVKPNKPDLTGAIRRASFEAQPQDGERWLLYSNLPVGVGGHGTYNLGDLGSADARISRLSRAIASAARAFLDAHAKADGDALRWLASDNARVLAGDVDWVRR